MLTCDVCKRSDRQAMQESDATVASHLLIEGGLRVELCSQCLAKIKAATEEFMHDKFDLRLSGP